MDFIYELFDTANETYYLQIDFLLSPSNRLDSYNKKHGTAYKSDFICYLPILVKVNKRTEAEKFKKIILDHLISEYKINVTLDSVSERALSSYQISMLQDNLNKKYASTDKGKLEIIKYEIDKPENTKSNVFNIMVTKVGSVDGNPNIDYMVQLWIVDNKLAIIK